LRTQHTLQSNVNFAVKSSAISKVTQSRYFKCTNARNFQHTLDLTAQLLAVQLKLKVKLYVCVAPNTYFLSTATKLHERPSVLRYTYIGCIFRHACHILSLLDFRPKNSPPVNKTSLVSHVAILSLLQGDCPMLYYRLLIQRIPCYASSRAPPCGRKQIVSSVGKWNRQYQHYFETGSFTE
jgi:hypothetical protein